MERLGTQKVTAILKKLVLDMDCIGDPTQWRLKKAMAGGGPLEDLGIYCIQGICYTTGMEPIAVRAQEGPKTDAVKFKEVEQSLSWQFEMPGGLIADGRASYSDNMDFLKAEAEKGVFELTSAYNYRGQRGNTPAGPMKFPVVNQQAQQMDAFAMSLKNKNVPLFPASWVEEM